MKNPATLRTRISAKFLDVILIVIAGVGVTYLFTGETGLTWSNAVGWDFFYLFYLILIPPICKGHVLGKKMRRIRMKKHGSDLNVTISDAFMREAVGFHMIAILTLGLSLVISMFMVAYREDKRAIHDIVGGTYVSIDK
ncbi:RDD family protein [Salimicrobium flavidum]|uniref:RDD family protein n=1 Tax=Salimicrobium flavidum TaxID=570947 RepID=A0A1N7KF58_9BACI|nr:RDD family protein [Salimicrobium flavidum]SIS60238.1 RDD family protein [Salimicrobium flavidum]